jgi:uncharacterized membrane protein YfcA
MADSWVFWLLAVDGVYFTGISKAGFAGAPGVVAVPMLALVLPVPQALMLMLPLLLLMDAGILLRNRKFWGQLQLGGLLPASVVGVVLGTAMLTVLPEALTKVLVGLLCLLLLATPGRLSAAWVQRRWAAPLFGAMAGLSSSLVHAGGPVLNAYLARQTLSPPVWIATAATFFGAVNLLKVPAYSSAGFFLPGGWTTVAWLVPAAIAGVVSGRILHERMTPAAFGRIMRVVLLLMALSLVVQGLLAGF